VGGFIEKFTGFTSAIEQTEVRVNVKMDKFGMGHEPRF
jgi:hypothetical protein